VSTEPEASRAAVARLDAARDAALAAGLTLLRMRSDVIAHGASATKSSDTDPVTRADVAAQQVIAAQLAAGYPDDGLLGEEGLTRDSRTGWQWVIDPLDGTVNYLYGRDDWAVSIAAQDAAGTAAARATAATALDTAATAVAVVYAPASGRMYTAVRGEGAWLGSQRLRVRDGGTLATAVVGTGFSYTSAGRRQQAATLARLLPRIADIRRGGSAALDLVAVASGTLDAFYENDLSPWDWAAGALLAAEAGALVQPLPAPLVVPAPSVVPAATLPAPASPRTGILAAPPHLLPALAAIVGLRGSFGFRGRKGGLSCTRNAPKPETTPLSRDESHVAGRAGWAGWGGTRRGGRDATGWAGWGGGAGWGAAGGTGSGGAG
jgi:myo-inositol-1(or 4)-monophosphatase